MPRFPVLCAGVAAGLVLAACGAPASTGGEASDPAATPPADQVPWCDDVPELAAPDQVYRDSPVYVANEQPVEEARAWAVDQGGFEDVMVDRDHNGWVTLVFSQGDRADLQAAVEQAFPGDGIAVVVVDRTRAELEAIQGRVGDVLDGSWGAGAGNARFVVEIDLGVARPERIAAVNEAFAGEPVCITGRDPAGEPEPGPQPTEGDGWRLLGTEPVGEPYRTGLAADQASYQALWTQVGMTADAPAVDFDTHVVIWFGAVVSGSCPDLRMDDVVVADGIVHMDAVVLGDNVVCTSDANPRAFLVALERDRLPSDGFAIQLGAAGPPAGAPEERTVVDADLTAPGSTPQQGTVGPDPEHDQDPIQDAPGNVIEPGFPRQLRMDLSCGATAVRDLNGTDWVTDAPQVDRTWIPTPWQSAVQDNSVVAEFLLTVGKEPTLTVTVDGHALTYTPSPTPPGCPGA